MKNVQLGNTDLEIKPIFFGGNVFGWTLNEEESFRILDGFLDRGFNAIDTANNYSYWVDGNVGTESERIIGNWIKSRGVRDQIVLATKVGGRNMIQDKPNTTKAHVLKEVEESLIRLQTDYIDLYQTHYDDVNTPVEETLSAYNQLIKEGKVRYIGASNFSSERLIESLDKSELYNLPQYKTLQPEYNLYDRQHFEEFLQPVAEKYNLAVIPYYSLASGFLSGKYKTEEDLQQSLRGEGIKKYLNERGFKILDALQTISTRYNISYSAVALAWLMDQKTVVVPIASATKEQHLDAFVEAVNVQLSHDDVKLLTEASEY
ncbi:aldo/keto reductase [Empedobacter falsenii]|uniref:Putative aldo-keto reductase n=1 Tax=Empedobacter falsenii TaxID=343874 RepID=A0A376GDR4_9FLAO|nr:MULTISPECIES: aldo/keto reductase [Empedobacter]MBW1618305.1 aldo/keto reductase [Empedobacter falsenii]MDH1881072.1 aldo/keto reductase [Empedobacter sp. GD03797]MDM1039941.1 aldo/keto reductase [Empedobacter brevis]MDM1133873.1 aldo/keto reductase [Empedobacter sp. R750]STD58949.1 putative aldo-keto reductase [Empedobacter falsenii]